MKKKKVATITKYPQHENLKGLQPWSVKQIFGEYAVNGIARFVTCNRGKPEDKNVQIIELHGNLIGPEVGKLGSDTWEILECEVILIPRRRLVSHRTEKDDKPMMSKKTAQQIYMGSDILNKMEESYLIRSDPDTSEYKKEFVEEITKQ